MKTIIKECKYDTKLEASDWRYGSAIVGLIYYFDFFKDVIDYYVEEDCIYYNSSDITEERFLKFVEFKYAGDMHHKVVEQMLCQDTYDEECINKINKILQANRIMQEIFSKVKFDGSNSYLILNIIRDNRNVLIRETFRNKSNLYANYCNTNLLFKNSQPHCRLVGYSIDEGRKSKAISYNFDANTFVGNDALEFDFIPFAFTNSRESFFINDNYTIKKLIGTNRILEMKLKNDSITGNNNIDARKVLLKSIIESSDFIDFDVEIIIKNRDLNYFQTMFLRKNSINILKLIDNDYKAFCFSYKINDNYYIDIEKVVTDCILNLIVLDDTIELLLKDKDWNYNSVINKLLKINSKLRGNNRMNKLIQEARECATIVVKKIQGNKVNSYNQKLISALVFKDYDKFCMILLQLSNFSNVSFDFAYKLFEDFEGNKDVAYSFVNALRTNANNKNENNIQTEGE